MRSLFSSLLMVMLVAAVAAADEPRFRRVDLVSDPLLNVHTQLKDDNLVNAWGLARGPTTPWWVANNGTGTATLYGIKSDGDVQKNPLVVSVDDTPTGQVFNGGDEFVVWDGKGNMGPARFIFATEAGTVWAWSPKVPPPTKARLVFCGGDDDVYKGLALATDHRGRSRLYVTDFHNARVIVLDGDFKEIDLGRHAFVDRAIPRGFAPFGIGAFGDRIIVTYAKQDADRHDDVAGPGNGFVDEYDLEGHLIRRVASRGALNSPWGLALGPESFG
ncbi:MAG TPA: TIGR03118 family protein, partial [Polyangia bacterium]